MRLLLIVMVALVGLIQYPLWMGRGGWFSVWDMQAQVVDQRMINEGLTARNVALAPKWKIFAQVPRLGRARAQRIGHDASGRGFCPNFASWRQTARAQVKC